MKRLQQAYSTSASAGMEGKTALVLELVKLQKNKHHLQYTVRFILKSLFNDFGFFSTTAMDFFCLFVLNSF